MAAGCARAAAGPPILGPYLTGRAELVDHYAAEVRDQATLVTELPRWAEPVSHDARLWRDLAMWRAANNIPDTDPAPAGAKLPPSLERTYQQKLETRVEKVVEPPKALPTAAMSLLHKQIPRVAHDPFWPVMARRLAAADWGSHDPEATMAAALALGPLPEKMPDAALWFRLAGQLRLTEAEVAPDIRLRPNWTGDLLRRLPDQPGGGGCPGRNGCSALGRRALRFGSG